MRESNETPRRQIERFLEEVAEMREEIADIDVPGWIIGKPTITELSKDLIIIVARSKDEEHIPYIPPDDAEVSIAVLEGSVRIDVDDRSVLIGRKFFVLSPGSDRQITPLEHPTKIYCSFFRTGVTSGGTAAPGR